MLGLLIGLFVGSVAPDLLGWQLGRRGYRAVDVASAAAPHAVEVRSSQHLFLDLPKLSERLDAWITKASAEGEDEGAAGKCSSFCFYAFSAQLEEAIAALSVDIRREESLLLAEPAYDDSDFMSIYCNTFGLSE
jgi:hypothetical protein